MAIAFRKYVAAGNDFIVVDASDFGLCDGDEIVRRLVRVAPRWCDRHFGIGGDGILLVERLVGGEAPHARMTIVNSDGTLAEMCGNGIRCASRYLERRYGLLRDGELSIETRGGVQRVRRDLHGEGNISVEIGRCEFVRNVDITLGDGLVFVGDEIDVGNPHVVIELSDKETGIKPSQARDEYGAEISRYREFRFGANVEFTREIAPDALEMSVYERGVGRTLACGTGCVASAYAYCRKRAKSGVCVSIATEGGTIRVDIPSGEFVENGGSDRREGVKSKRTVGLTLIGGAEEVFSGVVDLE